MTSKMASSMDSVPIEIHVQFLDHLDYRSQINFRACSHYYRNLPAVTAEKLTNLLLELEQDLTKTDPRPTSLHGFLPCYVCLKMKSRVLYCSEYLDQNRCNLGDCNSRDRICQQCRPGHDGEHRGISSFNFCCYCWRFRRPGEIKPS
jgi:hypothetical protein